MLLSIIVWIFIIFVVAAILRFVLGLVVIVLSGAIALIMFLTIAAHKLAKKIMRIK